MQQVFLAAACLLAFLSLSVCHSKALILQLQRESMWGN
jgi:hypothetical protein